MAISNGKRKSVSYATTKRRKHNYNVNQRVGGVIDLEKKYFDTFRANILPTTFAGGKFSPNTLNTLFCPTQGTGPSNRIGNKTLVHSIHIKLEFRGEIGAIASVSGRLSPSVYYALVLDTQCNGVEAATSDIWEPQSDPSLSLLPFRKIENSKRFRVLKSGIIGADFFATYNGTAAGYTVDAQRKFMMINKKFDKPIVVRHVGNGGTISDIAENSLQFYAWVRDTAHSDQLLYQCRVRYSG